VAWLQRGANGYGRTPDEAATDLREAVQIVFEEDGIPVQLAQSLEFEIT
jgi:hypothetical protein